MTANAANFTTPTTTVARRYAACVNLFEGSTTSGEATSAAMRIEALEAKGARFSGDHYFRTLLGDVWASIEEGDESMTFSILWGCVVDGWSHFALIHLIERLGRAICNRAINWMQAEITEWNDENTLVWNLLEV